MEKIKITFLGTGSAIPTANRNHPAILLQYKGENILVDCGEGTQRQFRYAKLNPCKLTRILITHWHADHVLGLPGIFQTLMLNGYTKKLEVYGPLGTKRMMQLYLGLFARKGQKFPIKVIEITKDQKVIETPEFFIVAKQMQHDTPTLAYSFVIKEKKRLDKNKLKKLKLPEKSQLIGELAKGNTIEFDGKKIDGKKLIFNEKQRKVSFIMDTKFNKQAIELAKDSDILICESTYSKKETEIAIDHSHLTSEQAATIAKRSNSKKLFLTHLSQRYDTKSQQKKILEEAKEIFKNSEMANDLMNVEA